MTTNLSSSRARRGLLAIAAVALLGFGTAVHAQTATTASAPAPGPTTSKPPQIYAPKVQVRTSAGDFVVELNPSKAPKTVTNFLQYVRDKHYDGTVFHRVIADFMVQGGGFTADMRQRSTRGPIELEAASGLKNDRGTVAMARQGSPNSATSQFFVNVVDNDRLNAPQPDGYGYAVFGRVVSGMEVVDKIRAVPTGSRDGQQNVPTTPVTIVSITEIK